MHMTVCDWCPGKYNKASYQFGFEGITPETAGIGDRRWHLCQRHRDELWDLHCQHTLTVNYVDEK